jgi:hypothetical protein
MGDSITQTLRRRCDPFLYRIDYPHCAQKPDRQEMVSPLRMSQNHQAIEHLADWATLPLRVATSQREEPSQPYRGGTPT